MTTRIEGQEHEISSDGGESKAGRSDQLTFKDNRYKYLSDLGSGGMSRVIRARDLTLKRDVAVKVLLTGAQHSPDVLRRFQREAQTTAQLNHPGIVNVLDFGVTDSNEPFLVMELLEGQSLSSYVNSKGGRLSQVETLLIMIDICAALEHAHKYDVLHRDIKPANVIVLEADRVKVKLIDFGLAKFREDDQSLTQTGVAIGSPPYMSPEQCSGKNVDVRSEVYSLGCVLFELLTGKRAFRADSAMELISLHMNGERPTLNEAVLDVDFNDSMEQVLAKCIAIDPNDRYQTVSDLKKDLDLEYGRFDRSHAKNSTSIAVEPYSKKNNPLASWAVIGGLAALAIIPTAAFLLLEPFKPKHYAMTDNYKLDKHRERRAEFDAKIVESENPFRLRRFANGPDVLEANTYTPITEEHLKKVGARRDFTKLRISKMDFSGRGLRYLVNTNLNDLDLVGNRIDNQGWKEMSLLTNLRNITMSFPDDFGDTDISCLSNLKKLGSVRIVCNKLTPNELKQVALIPHISLVTISHTKDLRPGALAALGTSRTIALLSLKNTELDPDRIRELRKLPVLKVLTIDSCPLTNASMTELSGLNITNLGLHNMPIGPKMLSPLLQSKTINGIEFAYCPGFSRQDAIAFVRKFKHPVTAKVRG